MMESERPIEKALRACAQKRGEEAGAPMELHPATRKLLQGEVARKYAAPQPREAPGGTWMKWLWPRFGLGVATLAVAAILGAFLGVFKKDQQFDVVQRETKSAVESAQLSASQTGRAAVAPAEKEGVTNELIFALKDSQGALKDMDARSVEERVTTTSSHLASVNQPEARGAGQSVTQPLSVAQSKAVASPDALSLSESQIESDAFRRRYGLSASPAPVTQKSLEPKPATTIDLAANGSPVAPSIRAEVSPAAPGGRADIPPAVQAPASAARARISPQPTGTSFAAEKQQRSAVQSFSQMPATKAKLDSRDRAASVLLSFQVEQNGDEMRIIDGDGSVYTGAWRTSENPPSLAPSKTETAVTESLSARTKREINEKAAPNSQQNQPTQTFFFTVSGTNRSLKQKVVFSGNLQSVMPKDFSSTAKNRENTLGKTAGPSQDGVLPLVNSQISGRAVIGDRKVVEINAVPTPMKQ